MDTPQIITDALTELQNDSLAAKANMENEISAATAQSLLTYQDKLNGFQATLDHVISDYFGNN